MGDGVLLSRSHLATCPAFHSLSGTENMANNSVYIAVVGPEIEYGVCRDSINNIGRRPGDALPRFIRATKGYEARNSHMEDWLRTDFDYALFLDHDMVYPPDTLERLRNHDVPYVSGYYMRRRYNPIAPVWFKPAPKNVWPMEPWIDEPERGKLLELGASGWGCILMHRKVALAVKEILKGEWLVAEDHMAIWPYDLPRIMRAVHGLEEITKADPVVPARMMRAALKDYQQTLTEEIRPLRGQKDDIVGSDLRFPFFAREAGYPLMGDPDTRVAHVLYYPVSPDDFTGIPDGVRATMKKNTRKTIKRHRKELKANLNNLERAGE